MSEGAAGRPRRWREQAWAAFGEGVRAAVEALGATCEGSKSRKKELTRPYGFGI
jgi:hypothetical protein